MDLDLIDGKAVISALYKKRKSRKKLALEWEVSMRLLQYMKDRNIGLLLYDTGYRYKFFMCFNRVTASLAFFDFEEVMTAESLWIRFCKNMTNFGIFSWEELSIPDATKRKILELCCITLSEYQREYLPCFIPRYDPSHIKTAKSDDYFSSYADKRKYDLQKQIELLDSADTGKEDSPKPADLAENFADAWRWFSDNYLATEVYADNRD